MKLREAGADVQVEAQTVRIKRNGRLKGVDIRTLPFPGFPTDMQAQMVALMALTEGTSVVTETVFESRFMHVEELRRMGADIGEFSKCLGELPCRWRNHSFDYSGTATPREVNVDF